MDNYIILAKEFIGDPKDYESQYIKSIQAEFHVDNLIAWIFTRDLMKTIIKDKVFSRDINTKDFFDKLDYEFLTHRFVYFIRNHLDSEFLLGVQILCDHFPYFPTSHCYGCFYTSKFFLSGIEFKFANIRRNFNQKCKRFGVNISTELLTDIITLGRKTSMEELKERAEKLQTACYKVMKLRALDELQRTSKLEEINAK